MGRGHRLLHLTNSVRTVNRSSIATDAMNSITKALSNIDPGEVLLEEFLGVLGICQNALVRRAACVPPRRNNEIVLGKRGVTADTALRLPAALGTSERFWLGLQADYRSVRSAARAGGSCQSNR